MKINAFLTMLLGFLVPCVSFAQSDPDLDAIKDQLLQMQQQEQWHYMQQHAAQEPTALLPKPVHTGNVDMDREAVERYFVSEQVILESLKPADQVTAAQQFEVQDLKVSKLMHMSAHDFGELRQKTLDSLKRQEAEIAKETAIKSSAPAQSASPAQQPSPIPQSQDTDDQSTPEFKKAIEASKQMAIKHYPDCAVEGSAFSKKMIEIADRLEAQHNDLVYSADAPWKIAQMAGNELGVAPLP